MTEAEWLVSEDPRDLLTALRDRASLRKLSLYDCACQRFCAPFLGRMFPLQVIEASEEYADHDSALAKWDRGAARAHEESEYARDMMGESAERLAQLVVEYAERRPPSPLIDLPRGSRAVERHVTAACASFLRDVFGNPFRSVTLAPEWRSDTVLALASQMYDSREFGALPILADALQEAGCDNADILDHCRGPGPHARGCWVVDLVLGKE